MEVMSYGWECDHRDHCVTACFTAQLLAAVDQTDLRQNKTHSMGWQTTISSGIYSLTNHETLRLPLPFPTYLLITQRYTSQSAKTTITGTSRQSINRLIGYCQTFITSATLKVKTRQMGGKNTDQWSETVCAKCKKRASAKTVVSMNSRRSKIQLDGLSGRLQS